MNMRPDNDCGTYEDLVVNHLQPENLCDWRTDMAGEPMRTEDNDCNIW